MFAALAQTTATTPRVTGTEVLLAAIAVIVFFALTRSGDSTGYGGADFERFAEEACAYLYDQECVWGS